MSPGYSKGVSYSKLLRLEFGNRTVVFGDWGEPVEWIFKYSSDSIGSSEEGSTRFRVESESGATLALPCDDCNTLAENAVDSKNATNKSVQNMAFERGVESGTESDCW